MVLLAHLSQLLSLRIVQKAWSQPLWRTFFSILVSLLDSTQKCPNRLSLNTHRPRLFFNWSWQVTGKKNYPVWSWSITIYTPGLRRGLILFTYHMEEKSKYYKVSPKRRDQRKQKWKRRGRRKAREERIKERSENIFGINNQQHLSTVL